MIVRTSALSLALVATLGLAGCATTMDGQPYYGRSSAQQYDQYSAGAQQVTYGTITDIRPVAIQNERNPGTGAILGAVIGGVVGNQIGHGSGRTLATVGGAVAGGVAGNQIQRSRNHERGVQVTVRMSRGMGSVAVIQNDDQNLYVGQWVQIIGTGNQARVVPAGR